MRLILFLAGPFWLIVTVFLLTGWAPDKNTLGARRSKDPTTYWISTAIWIAIAIVVTFVAWRMQQH